MFHTASPFALNVKDPQKDLVDPAKLGTRNVLEEVNRQPSVKRVVLTSSCAAIYSDNADCEQATGGMLNEADWNTTSSLRHQPYSYSKTIAEKVAWEIVKRQSRWDLVVINPSLVLGPGINPNSTSESYRMIRQLGDGSLKSGAPRYCFGCVDVRDVAQAHLAAAWLPGTKGRHIVSGQPTDLFALAQILLPTYGEDYPIPRKAMPKWQTWLLAPLANRSMTRKIVSLNVDIPWVADNSKSIRNLGLRYRPLTDTVNEMFQQLIDNGAFEK